MSCDNVPTTAEIAQAKKDVNDFNTFMTSDADTFVDSNGISRLTLQGAVNKFGFGIAPFTFATGGTLTNLNLLVPNSPTDGYLYKYIGSGGAPIVVTAGTNPVGNPDWYAFTATAAEFISKAGGSSVQNFIDYFSVGSLNNTSYGNLSFSANTTGYNNTAVGYSTLQVNTTGYDNTVFGVQAMKDNTTGNRNTAIGTDALAKNTTGDHNLALGQNALGFNTTGTYNTALGIDALEYGTNNSFNTAIGQYAALNLEGSSNNTVIGYNTFQAATSGNSNVTLGSNTLQNQNGVTGNTALGTDAGRDNISGTQLTLVGYRAGRSNTTGTHLIAIGDQAAFKNTTGTHNFALGFTALYSNLTSSYNIAIGDSALYSVTAGNNIGIGNFAGYSVTTGTHNTFIGFGSGYNASQKIDVVNSTAIGRGSYTTEDNAVQLGNASVTKMGVGANKIAWLAAVPTTGTWARGDIVWNLSATAGGLAGWICTAAGTPGTWKTFGVISA